jgi:Xaa-Pro aminopeptidase
MFALRHRKLRNFLVENNAAACVVTHANDVWWLTGLRASFGYVVFLDTGQGYLITDSRYAGDGRVAAEKAGLEFVMYDKAQVEFLCERVSGIVLMQPRMEVGDMKRFESFFSIGDLQCVGAFMQEIRREKTHEELDMMRVAQAHVDSILPGFLQENLQAGRTEKEIAFALEIALRDGGRFGLSFDPIIAFGVNTAAPHHMPGETKLERNMPVLIDCGVTFEGYCSDMTRNAFFGTVSEEYAADYARVLAAQVEVVFQCWEGSRIEVLSAYCREKLGDLNRFFTHSLGHGVGIEVHEMPGISLKSEGRLRNGDVITIEPGIYKPGKYGIRIEDILVIHENQPEVLSNMSKELIVIA